MILDQFPDASDLYSDMGAISRCAKVWSWRDITMMTMMFASVKSRLFGAVDCYLLLLLVFFIFMPKGVKNQRAKIKN